MSDGEPISDVPVHHRGRIAKTAFVVFVLVPAAGLAAAVLWFCVSQGKPLPIAAAVLVVLFLMVDRLAHGTFCRVEFTPEGLLYRGGGVFWRRVRKERVLSWVDYVYVLVPGIQHWVDVYVVEKAKCDPSRRRSDQGHLSTLDLTARFTAYSEFDALARAILIHNPEVIVRYRKRPRRTPGASTERIGNVDVSGDEEFRKRTVAALRLLEERDPVNYARLQKYIAHIVSVESKFHGLWSAIDYETGTIEVYRKSRFSGKWYASLIAERVCTYMLHHRFKFSAHNPESGLCHVKITSRAHVRSLMRLGGSEADIEVLEKGLKKGIDKWRK